MMPADARQGRRSSDHRMVVTGSCSGPAPTARGGTCPVMYGNWKTVYNRHRRWALDGTWENILGRLQAGCDEAEGKDWTLSADAAGRRWAAPAAG
jgi:transposase